METRRLTKFVDPRQAQLLLDSYVVSFAKLPASASKQLDLARLPVEFHERVKKGEMDGSVWSAWIHGSNAWLFIGQLNLNRARERGQPVLELEVYDYERRTKKRVITLRSSNDSWQVLED